MKKSLYIIITFFLIGTLNILGQNQAKMANLSQKASIESIYVHYSNNLLLTGEYLFFRIDVINKKQSNYSNLSKLGYVELLSAKGDRIAIKKVTIKDGMGDGEIFIPTNTPSGYYKLIGYTKATRSGQFSTFFKDDIVIINPYTNEQKVFWPNNESTVDGNLEDLKSGAKLDNNSNRNPIELQLNKSVFSTRDRVELQLEAPKNLQGSYSLSVRKLTNPLTYSIKKNPFNAGLKNERAINENNKIIPEVRSEIIQGTLRALNNEVSAANRKIAFSLPGFNNEFRIVNTDNNGDFAFNLEGRNLESNLFYKILDGQIQDFKIEIENLPILEVAEEEILPFILTPDMENSITKRSVYNQIENAFYGLKPDTVLLENVKISEFGNKFISYELDEYTRFPSFKETLVEVVDNAWITNQGGKSSIFVRDTDATRETVGYEPLVVVDGLYVTDHQSVINYPASKIKTIKVFRNQYTFGGTIYQGIFQIETFEKDFFNLYADLYANLELLRPDVPKKRFKQLYGKEQETSIIPDFRHQLYWNPYLRVKNAITVDYFFTSDVPGEYVIELEGFSDNLSPIRSVKKFTVK
ncbi:hypothetical protein [Croceivirga radicis]|uniref:hypothetical protein n=1 Tax=Croceivirga radicis TaxID=1929488 RepID=UPI000255AC03|nr:hypothetical protein [Croceivirga radicis]